MQRKGRIAINSYEQTRAGTTTTSATTIHELRNPKSHVIGIDPVNISRRLIIVVQEDGSVTSIRTEDKTDRHDHKMELDSGAIKLQTVQAMSLEEARTSVLKGRPDISATLTNDYTIVAASYVAGQESATPASVLNLGIWALAPSTGAASANQVSSTPILTYDLRTNTKCRVRFRSANTKLEIITLTSVSTFDLTAVTPQKISDRKHFTSDQTSDIELSHDVYLSYGSGTLNLYNSKFNSLLATKHISNIPLKRKRDRPGSTRLSFIAYFSQLRRILAYNGSQVLAVDVHVTDSVRDPFRKSSLLVGNLLRGKPDQTRTATQPPVDTNNDQHWLNTAQELDVLANSQEVSRFEQKLKDSLGVRSWEDLKKLETSQIKFLLSRIFTLESEDDARDMKLKLKFLPAQLLKWCIKCGFLDDYQVATALETRNPDLAPGAIPNCLQQADEELSLLQEYIKNARYIEPSALTWTIKSLIDRVLRTPESDAAQHISLTSVVEVDEPDIPQDPIRGSVNAQVQSIHSTSCLIYALKRLALTGSVTVSDQVRMVLEQKEVLTLIQFLRQQLFLGGYTRLAEVRNYPSPPPSQVGADDALGDEKPQMTLENIVALLNGCIDSLGVVGILGSNEDQAFIERMVPELYSEIESATAAVEDSTFLQGILRETLRYAESVERQPFEVRSKVERTNDIRGRKGKVVTLYTENDTTETGAQLPTALPLSLKAEEDLSQRKIRKGGQVQSRSAREMGMLKDRLKAPYSFERLVL